MPSDTYTSRNFVCFWNACGRWHPLFTAQWMRCVGRGAWAPSVPARVEASSGREGISLPAQQCTALRIAEGRGAGRTCPLPAARCRGRGGGTGGAASAGSCAHVRWCVWRRNCRPRTRGQARPRGTQFAAFGRVQVSGSSDLVQAKVPGTTKCAIQLYYCQCEIQCE